MKVFTILVISFCVTTYKINAEDDSNSDIDYELFKHLDVSPIHTSFDHDVDFDEPYSAFDSTYDGGGSEIHDDNNNESNNNQQNDEETKKKTKENNNNVAGDHGAKKNSGDYDDDDDEEEDGEEHEEGTENDENDEEGDESEDDDEADESKIETTTIKVIDPRGSETVDPDSSDYISPDDVAHRLSREKRSKKTDKTNNGNEYDFAQSYRDFVREHFGVDEAQALSDDNKQKKKKEEEEEDDEEEADNGDAEEDEDYEEGAEDGESEDDDRKPRGAATANAQPDDSYDDDDEEGEDGDEERTADDNNSNSSSNEDDDYKKVKKLSQDTDENPQFCKVVYKDNQECQVCKNPKTHDKSETCSYSSSPAPKRYAYKKEKNYNSNDDFGDDEGEREVKQPKKKSKKNKAKKHKSNYNNDSNDDFSSGYTKKKAPKSKSKSKKHSKKNKRSKPKKENETMMGGFQPSPYYYGYQDRQTQTPLRSHYFGESDGDLSFRASESLPVKASSETYDKDIDVFKGRDWSRCTRKINNEGLTCYYCKDSDGATQEECMYIAGNDEDNPLQRKSKDKNSRTKKGKKTKRNNPNIQKAIGSVTTTNTTAPQTISAPQLYNTKPNNLPDQNKLNINLNSAPPLSSWQINHNSYPQPQWPRTLNRNQNFNISPIPITRQNSNLNPLRIPVPYGITSSSGTDNPSKNFPIFGITPKSTDPGKTLEYTEPKNRQTLKRMIKLRVINENDSEKPKSTADNDATVFYSKVLHKF